MGRHGDAHCEPVTISENARRLPVSAGPPSTILSVHVPFGFSAANDASAPAGRKLPENGFAEDASDEKEMAAASSNVVLQKLTPALPEIAVIGTCVPAGEINVIARSPTNVWSRPTVVDPGVALQLVPSSRNLMFASPPERPLTTSGTVIPVVLLSGIATGGPV